MLRKTILVSSFIVALLFVEQLASASQVPQTVGVVRSSPVQNRDAYRQTIRQTPILQRPNRPGHFYGNAVRRRHRASYGR